MCKCEDCKCDPCNCDDLAAVKGKPCGRPVPGSKPVRPGR